MTEADEEDRDPSKCINDRHKLYENMEVKIYFILLIFYHLLFPTEFLEFGRRNQWWISRRWNKTKIQEMSTSSFCETFETGAVE